MICCWSSWNISVRPCPTIFGVVWHTVWSLSKHYICLCQECMGIVWFQALTGAILLGEVHAVGPSTRLTDIVDATCYRCGQKGHTAAKCRLKNANVTGVKTWDTYRQFVGAKASPPSIQREINSDSRFIRLQSRMMNTQCLQYPIKHETMGSYGGSWGSAIGDGGRNRSIMLAGVCSNPQMFAVTQGAPRITSEGIHIFRGAYSCDGYPRCECELRTKARKHFCHSRLTRGMDQASLGETGCRISALTGRGSSRWIQVRWRVYCSTRNTVSAKISRRRRKLAIWCRSCIPTPQIVGTRLTAWKPERFMWPGIVKNVKASGWVEAVLMPSKHASGVAHALFQVNVIFDNIRVPI